MMRDEIIGQYAEKVAKFMQNKQYNTANTIAAYERLVSRDDELILKSN